ncbi:MAG: hypothetical protein IPP74_05935 [Alphaproteobacteria bacterium]|nr:hypothetical protein [Alphaproteobacteria bacterium]
MVENPGGFPEGITEANILDKQNPRNRRIAEAFEKCGLVERSGQGVDLMFSTAVIQSKPLPEYTGTDKHNVLLAIYGQIKNPEFLNFLEQVGSKTLASFTAHHLIVIDKVFEDKKLFEAERKYAKELVDLGILERSSNQYKFILSQRFHDFMDRKGEYTRRKGLSKNHHLTLIEEHLRRNKKHGCPFDDFRQVLPHAEDRTIRYYLAVLKKSGKAECKGAGRNAKWYAV